MVTEIDASHVLFLLVYTPCDIFFFLICSLFSEICSTTGIRDKNCSCESSMTYEPLQTSSPVRQKKDKYSMNLSLRCGTPQRPNIYNRRVTWWLPEAGGGGNGEMLVKGSKLRASSLTNSQELRYGMAIVAYDIASYT